MLSRTIFAGVASCLLSLTPWSPGSDLNPMIRTNCMCSVSVLRPRGTTAFSGTRSSIRVVCPGNNVYLNVGDNLRPKDEVMNQKTVKVRPIIIEK